MILSSSIPASNEPEKNDKQPGLELVLDWLPPLILRSTCVCMGEILTEQHS